MLFGRIGGSAKVNFIIAGLGNPGPKYESTRHNTGFMFLDTLAKQCGADVNRLKFKSLCGRAEIEGVGCLLMKPQTLMNNSGEAVAEAARFYHIPPERIIVAFDDISLKPGTLRIRRKGSDGGHNGIKSIIMCLDSEDFPRIKLGVGEKPHPDYDLAAWVLSRFSDADKKLVSAATDAATEAVKLMVSGDVDGAMSRFNGFTA